MEREKGTSNTGDIELDMDPDFWIHLSSVTTSPD